MAGGVLLLPPSSPDPGDGWYRVTFGTKEELRCWVDFYSSDVLTFPDGHVVQAKDLEAFLLQHPEHRKEVE